MFWAVPYFITKGEVTAPKVVKSIFQVVENPSEPRSNLKFKIRNIDKVRHKNESLSIAGARIYSIGLPGKYKECDSIKELNTIIKTC